MKRSYHGINARQDHRVGERVRNLRLSKKLSLRDVASRGGPTVATQHLVESGLVTATTSTLRKLANVFGVRMAEFLFVEQNEFEKVAELVYGLAESDVRALLEKLEKRQVG